MTATEVLQRQEEKMRNIAPMTGRMQSEYLGPMVTRVYNIAFRRNMLPELPGDLTGAQIKIEYSSPVARAQKATQLQNVTRLLEAFVPLINIKPEIADKFNGDGYFDWAHDLLDAPTAVSTSKDEIKMIREKRAKAQQEAQMKEDAMSMTEGGLNMAKSQNLLTPNQ